jgi:hypothetical protein
MASLTLPFDLRGAPGRVRVEIFVNDDPVRIGHRLVAIGFDAERFRGFPVAYAFVDYDGVGLHGWMGWMQTISRSAVDGSSEFDVDCFPLGAPDSPLYAYGYLPTFFDAPANPDQPDGVWQADTWLVAIPDVIRTRRLGPIVGFRWGYRLEHGRPQVGPLAPLNHAAWLTLVPQVRSMYPNWEFLEEI